MKAGPILSSVSHNLMTVNMRVRLTKLPQPAIGTGSREQYDRNHLSGSFALPSVHQINIDNDSQ